MVPALTLLAACGGGSDKDGSSPTTPTARPLSVEDLAHAVVQIEALDAFGETVWTGSGTFISAEGHILTNAHVVDDRLGEYDTLAVATTSETDQPPERSYLAKIEAVDYALDLAVVSITSDLDGNPVEVEFPFVPVGDSDSVQIGDEIRILGYPGIGGETITLTEGVISGFTSDRSVGARAWIKTNATITGGNSGGLAVNTAGVLIGVPTIAGSGSEEETVDCRYVSDTNRDGNIDEADTCVPVGGFINGLRPANLAAPLVDAALAGREYASEIEPAATEPPSGFDTDTVVLSNLVFAEGVTEDDEPKDVRKAMPSRVTTVCGFWDFAGMADGMGWEALWFVDGELSEDGSILEDTWVGGIEGNWWVCILDEEAGLADGLYELVISVEGEPQGSSAIFVGGDHPDVRLEIDNQSTTPLCYVYLSPSGAQNWGFDQLGAEEAIPPGDRHQLEVPAASYDLLIEDCDQNGVIDERELSITEDLTYTVTD